MVLTAYSALSPATNSSCHRHRRIKVCRTRSGRLHLHRLDTSNGCQDHTASPYAGSISRLVRCSSLTGLIDPPCDFIAPKRRRVHASRTYVRDDRETPLVRDGMAVFIEVIRFRKNRNIFCDRAGQAKARAVTDLPVGQISKWPGAGGSCECAHDLIAPAGCRGCD
jgi:hypothetical protein